MLEGKAKTIGEMAVGETGHCYVLMALTVDSEGRCRMRLTSPAYPVEPCKPMRFEIRREDDGFHIVIPRQQYTPGTVVPTISELAVSVTFEED